jgi:hypothetical protein
MMPPLGTSGNWRSSASRPAENKSLVVARTDRSIGGRGTFLPSRLLYEVLPSALLEATRSGRARAS